MLYESCADCTKSTERFRFRLCFEGFVDRGFEFSCEDFLFDADQVSHNRDYLHGEVFAIFLEYIMSSLLVFQLLQSGDEIGVRRSLVLALPAFLISYIFNLSVFRGGVF